MSLPIHYCATRQSSAPRARILSHLSEPEAMARWCLGMLETRALGDGMVAGRSLFSGQSTYAHIQVDHERGEVRYRVGSSATSLKPWISALVIDGAPLGYATGTQFVSLCATRPASMDDTAWQRIMSTHETEIDLIVAQLQADTSTSR